MPNWTTNKVDVKGEKQEIDRFRCFVSTGHYSRPYKYPELNGKLPAFKDTFSFENILPCPALLYESICPTRAETESIARLCESVYGSDNWYNWCLAHWGTKKDACDIDCETVDDGTAMHYEFLTAWSAPSGIASGLRSLFPNLTIEWEALNEEDWAYETDSNGDFVDALPWDQQPERYAV